MFTFSRGGYVSDVQSWWQKCRYTDIQCKIPKLFIFSDFHQRMTLKRYGINHWEPRNTRICTIWCRLPEIPDWPDGFSDQEYIVQTSSLLEYSHHEVDKLKCALDLNVLENHIYSSSWKYRNKKNTCNRWKNSVFSKF